MNRSFRRAAFALRWAGGCAASLCAFAGNARADQIVYTFAGPWDGEWNTPTNWVPTGVPGDTGSDVAIIHTGSHARLGYSGPILRVIDRLQVDAGAQLELVNDFDLYVRGQSNGLGATGLLTIPGTLLLSSGGNATDLVLSGGTYVTFGGGTPSTPALIEMSNNFSNRIFGSAMSERLDIQPAATIRGAGQIGLNMLSIANQGAIVARGSAGITIDPNGAGMANAGVLRAETGPLVLTAGAFNNAGGQIIADGSDVYLVNCDLTGGVLNSTGAGVVRAGATGGGTVLHAITNQGVLRMPNDMDFYAYGTITNVGTIQMRSAGNGTDIYLPDNLTLAGTGTFDMSNWTENRVFDPGGSRGFVLTNAGNTIVGSGQIGMNTIDVVNQANGSILASGTAGLNIDPSNTFTNLGTLAALSGGHLILTSGAFTLTSPAVAQDGGVVHLNGGSFTGTIASSGSGYCRLNTMGGTTALTNLTNTGRLDLPNDFDAVIVGTLTNQGTINLMSAGNGTDLYISGHVTIAGQGSIVMSNRAENQIFDPSGNLGYSLTNASTIVGSGQIGRNTIDIVNQPAGTIAAAGPAGLYIDPASTMVNSGTMRADSGGRLEFEPGSYTFFSAPIAMDGGIIAFNGGTFTGSLATQGSGACDIITSGGSTVFTNLSSFARVQMYNDRDLVLLNTFDNHGVLSMMSAGNGTDIYVHADVVLTGGGLIDMSNNAQNNFYDSAGNRGFTMTNVDNTIRGAGRIGLNSIAIVNQAGGSILATQPAGIEIDPSSTFLNQGTLRAQAGSFINFAPGVYTFASPAVAGDGGVIALSGGTYSGTINSEGSGYVRSNTGGASTLLTNLTNMGSIVMPNDYDLAVAGSIANAGSIAMNSAGNGTDIYVIASTTLSGGGAINMSVRSENNIYDPGGNRGFTLTNADNTILGSGRIGLNTLDIVNGPGGHIIAGAGAGVEIDGAASIVNQGEMRASGSTLFFHPVPNFTNTGTLIADAGRLIQFSGTSLRQTAGLTAANGEVQVDNDAFMLEGGTLIGAGRVDSAITNINGVVSPGTSTNDAVSFAVLTIEGAFTQSQTGETLVELGGGAPGTEHDRLVVTGVATTGGMLRVRLAPGYAPAIGTAYDVITAASVVGGYDAIIAENVSFNNQLNVAFLPDRVRVIVEVRCLGDYDGDGGITGADISAFFADYEQGGANADLDQDGGITGADMAEFFTRYESGC